MKKLVLIDGNSLINRAFYAMPLLSSSDGVFTNAVYGFVNMLIRIIEDNSPDYMCVAFDRKAPTFRHLMYSEYKAGRKKMPEELAVQLPILKEVLASFKIATYEQDGIEADDIIGTLSKKFNIDTIIFTGDKDELQLVDDNVSVFLTKVGISNLEKISITNFFESYGYLPNQVIEFKALCGDSSDNIKGVTKIGEKTAIDLISKYGYLENIYANIDKIKGKLQENLLLDKDMAFLSRTLATIKTDCKIDLSLDDLKLDYPFDNNAREVLKKYKFTKLLLQEKLFVKCEQVCEYEFTAQTHKLDSLDKVKKTLDRCQKQLAIHIGENIVFAFNKEEQYEVELAKTLFDVGATAEQIIPLFSQVLQDKKIKKILFDSKTFRYLLKSYSMTMSDNQDDIMLKSYVARSYSRLYGVKELLDNFNINENYAASALIYINEVLQAELENCNQVSLYFDVELPLAKVLFEMENQGFKLDKAVLENLHQAFSQRLKLLTDQIFSLAGECFNINSPKQLAKILFEKLNLKSGKKTKSGLSTNIEVLENLVDEHPIIEIIIEYRTLAKLLSTYVEGLMSQMDENGKVHTIYNQALTTTGRLSSSEPNLQNLPKRDKTGRLIRKAFIPEFDYLVSCDYSQIELRLLAHFSQDEKLKLAYEKQLDIHTLTASQVFNVPFESVSKEERQSAKAVNFGIIYGISDFGLAKQLGISVAKAKKYIADYFSVYSKVAEYMQSCKDFASKNGYVETLLHRRRYLPEINSSNYNIRSFAQRAAMNMPLQGTSADLIKIAMIRTYNSLKAHNLKSKLILTIHDELVVDTLASELGVVKQLLQDSMQNAMQLNIPLVAEVKESLE